MRWLSPHKVYCNQIYKKTARVLITFYFVICLNCNFYYSPWQDNWYWTCPAATSHKIDKMHKSTVLTSKGKYDIQRLILERRETNKVSPTLAWAFFLRYFPNYNAINKGPSKSNWAEEAEIRFWSWWNGEFLEQEIGRRGM